MNTFLFLTCVILMIAGALGGRRHRGYRIVLGVAAVLALVLAARSWRTPQADIQQLISATQTYYELAGRHVAAKLHQAQPDSTALLLRAPGALENQRAAFREGFLAQAATQGMAVEEDRLAPSAAYRQALQGLVTGWPEEEGNAHMRNEIAHYQAWLDHTALDLILTARPNPPDWVIALFDLPTDLAQARVWNSRQGPQLIGLEVPQDQLQHWIDRPWFYGSVQTRPGVDVWRLPLPPPGNLERAFDQRFDWVTERHHL